MKHFSFALTFAFSSALAFLSCSDSDPFTPGPNQVNLQAPVVDQENYYLSYAGVCGQLEPTGDTLILRIKEIEELGTGRSTLQLEEIFTEGSPSFQPQGFIYPAQWTADFLDILPEHRQQSQLFFFYGSDTLRLKQSPAIDLFQNNCVVWNGPDGFAGDYIGRVPSFSVGQEHYQNMKIVSCVPVILDLDAYLVYDHNNLYSSFTSLLGGFDEDNQVRAYALIEK